MLGQVYDAPKAKRECFSINSKDDVSALTLPNPLEKGFLLVDGDVMLLYTVSFENKGKGKCSEVKWQLW